MKAHGRRVLLKNWQQLLKATDASAETNREDGSALKDALERQGGGGSGDAVRPLERGLLRGVENIAGKKRDKPHNR